LRDAKFGAFFVSEGVARKRHLSIAATTEGVAVSNTMTTSPRFEGSAGIRVIAVRNIPLQVTELGHCPKLEGRASLVAKRFVEVTARFRGCLRERPEAAERKLQVAKSGETAEAFEIQSFSPFAIYFEDHLPITF